jgi:hypothetical protein
MYCATTGNCTLINTIVKLAAAGCQRQYQLPVTATPSEALQTLLRFPCRHQKRSATVTLQALAIEKMTTTADDDTQCAGWPQKLKPAVLRASTPECTEPCVCVRSIMCAQHPVR